MKLREPEKSNNEEEGAVSNRGLVKLAGPLWLIAVGVILLLNTTGVLPWSVWNILLRFWPVLLIVWGATMILDGKAKTGALTGLVLLALLGVFIISAVVPGARRLAYVDDLLLQKEFSISGPDYHPDEFRLRVGAGSGEVKIVTDDGLDIFASKARYTSPATEPSLTTSYSGGVLEAEYDAAQLARISGPVLIPTRSQHEITLGQPSLPTFLEIRLGSGTVDAFLEGLAVRDVEVEVGSGKLVLTFPSCAPGAGYGNLPRLSVDVGSGRADISQLGNAGMGRVSGIVGSGAACLDFSGDASVPALVADFEVGSGRLELRVPEDAGLSIEPTIRSGSLQIGGRRYGRDDFNAGQRWVSENYAIATRRIDMVVRVGSGRIEVEHRR